MDLATIRELIEHYRKTAQFYLKLNYAGIGGLGAIIAFFEIQRSERILLLDSIWPGFHAAGGALLFALIYDCLLLEAWAQAKAAKNPSRQLLPIKAGAFILLLANIALAAFLGSFLLNYIRGYASGFTEGRGLAVLHTLILEYKRSNGKFPSSLADLTVRSPEAAYAMRNSGTNKLVYKRTKQGFILQHAGPDEILDTADDTFKIEESPRCLPEKTP